MIDEVMDRVRFLYISEPQKDLKIFVRQAVGELVPVDYFMCVCSMYDITIEEAVEDFCKNIYKNFLKSLDKSF